MDHVVRDHADRRGDRRLHRTPFHFPERRTGFDRRLPRSAGWSAYYDANLRSYRDSKSMFLLVLATVVVFNYVDYLLTFRVLRAGGIELNPIIAYLFEISPVLAASIKLGGVGVAVLVLLMLRRYRRTLEASLVLLASYTALMFYHAALALRLT